MSVTYSSGIYGSLSEEDAECVYDRLLNVLALRLEVKRLGVKGKKQSLFDMAV